MAVENRRIQEIESTIINARQNMEVPQTFLLSEDDTTSGGKEGTLASGDLTKIKTYAVEAETDVASGTVTHPPVEFGAITAPSITTESLSTETIEFTKGISDGKFKNGFNGKQEDIAAKFSFEFSELDSSATLSYTDGSDIDVYVANERFAIPDGDPRLDVPALTEGDGWYTYYIDTDGQLKASKSMIEALFPYKCLVMSVYYSTTDLGIPGGDGYGILGHSISQLYQHHGAANYEWRLNHHYTEKSEIVPGSFELSTDSTILAATSNLGVGVGTLFDEDISRTYPAVDMSTGLWVSYYYEGIDAVDNLPISKRGYKTVLNLTQLFVTSAEAGIAGGDTNIVYSEIVQTAGTYTTVEPRRVDDDHYTLGHVFIGMGPLVSNVIISGQNQYESLEIARSDMKTDLTSTYGATEVLSDTVMIGTVIFDHSGNIMPINDDGLMIVDLRQGENEGIFGSSSEVVIPDGLGSSITSTDISLKQITTSENLVLEQLGGLPGQMLVLGANGSLTNIDLFGVSAATLETYLGTDQNIVQSTISNGSTVVYATLGIEHEFTRDVNTVIVSYEILATFWRSSRGLNIRIEENGVPLTTLDRTYTNYGNSSVISGTFSIGNQLSGTKYEIFATANRKNQSVIIEQSELSISGSTGSSSTALFIETNNGIGTGTTLLENLQLTNLQEGSAGLALNTVYKDAGTLKIV